jgi:hypothetical protein
MEKSTSTSGMTSFLFLSHDTVMQAISKVIKKYLIFVGALIPWETCTKIVLPWD